VVVDPPQNQRRRPDPREPIGDVDAEAGLDRGDVVLGRHTGDRLADVVGTRGRI
jgi:hypothetical protein